MHGWPGTDDATWVVEHADHRAETPLEYLGRLACIEGGLPVPLSNVWVGDGYPLLEREWALRRLGLDVVRYDWELAAHRRDELAAQRGGASARHLGPRQIHVIRRSGRR